MNQCSILYLPFFTPTSLNKGIGRHWAVKNRQKKGDREIIAYEASRQVLPKAKGKRRVSLRIVLPKGQRAIDPDNAWKGILDGLKHAGLLVNDSWAWCETGTVEFVRHPGTLRETFVVLEDIA